MSNTEDAFMYIGQVVHSLSLENLELIENGIVTVQDGIIVSVEKTTENLEDLQKLFKVPDERVYKLDENQLLMPGLVDTHIHAAQYPNAGLGYDLTLLDWLQTYTFPLEDQYKDSSFAKTIYEAVVRRTLACGTTTACYYATIHGTALILAEEAESRNQRALVGKINMNVNPGSSYVETLESTIADTLAFLEGMKGKKNVLPVITPRFALSCDMPCMIRLAEIAAASGLHIQTHISENTSEVEAVASVYPDCANYASVYDKAGLLTEKTILAHGVYLTDEELALIKSKGCSITHCANSNLSLMSGLCPVRRLLNAGLKVALGTDCSGGYSVSIIDSMRQAIQTSVAVSFSHPQWKKLTIPEVFYMATLGGAKALALDDRIGNFLVGKEFDALVVDLSLNPATEMSNNYSPQELFERFIWLADDRNIAKVYVAGRQSF